MQGTGERKGSALKTLQPAHGAQRAAKSSVGTIKCGASNGTNRIAKHSTPDSLRWRLSSLEKTIARHLQMTNGIPRHRGESITPELAYKGWQWESMRHQTFTAKGPHYRDQAAEAQSRADFYNQQLIVLTGVGVE